MNQLELNQLKKQSSLNVKISTPELANKEMLNIYVNKQSYSLHLGQIEIQNNDFGETACITRVSICRIKVPQFWALSPSYGSSREVGA